MQTAACPIAQMATVMESGQSVGPGSQPYASVIAVTQGQNEEPGIRFRTTTRIRLRVKVPGRAFQDLENIQGSRDPQRQKAPGSIRHPEQTETLTLIHLRFWLPRTAAALALA